MSRGERLVVAGLGLVTGLTSAVVIGLAVATPALTGRPRPWMFVSLEAVALVAGVVCLLALRGLFRHGPGLGLLSVAGTIGAAGLLGFVAASRELAGYSLLPYLGLRGVTAVALAAVGAWTVLKRRPGSLGRAVVGGLLCLPLLAAAVVFASAGLRTGLADALGPWALWVIAGIGAVLLPAGVHVTVGAFERTNERAPA